ncbi:MAG: 4-(cytidine 5'-diphospho)-2-C-methyl-D-erythritol kinase [Clostridia bacterium]|nr:4-(cytidine 5'-diphospho)-2-C-methyl-D-erythritol kinase [Clostridia bacterium]
MFPLERRGMMQNNTKIYEDFAPAKINLYLDVLSKMDSGYHNIDSIMQSVSLFDKVSLKISHVNNQERIIEIESSSGKIPNDKSNIVYKCAEAILSHTHTNGIICKFFIEKNIPIAAGMAGGSSDGACAMKLLNTALGNPLSLSELCSIGAKIGADIPFCLTGKTAICQEIGDKITPITSLSDALIVCAIDNSSVSTPEAFKLLDEKYGTNCSPSNNIEEIIQAINEGNISKIGRCLYNKFESVIEPDNKSITQIKATMLNNGAIGALMSGSGPSVFGIFTDENSQLKAFNELQNQSIRAFLCKTI